MQSIDPETQPLLPETPPVGAAGSSEARPEPLAIEAPEIHDLYWVLAGSQGLRAGWSLLVFAVLYRLLTRIVGMLVVELDPAITKFDFSPAYVLIGELVPLLALVGTAAFVAIIERRCLLDYNLTGPRRSVHFFGGLAAGFTALSALVGALALGGWLRFGPVGLSGVSIISFAALWGLAFLAVGLFEEGAFRCYLQFTLTRGINFWWALAMVGALCLDLVLRTTGNGAGILTHLWLRLMPAAGRNGVWGIYAVALLGLFPCLMLHIRKTPRSGFWQAAWVTSTLFGFIHTGNYGENWIGIFAASFIGFVFCVSVWVTGSAWWAIGCHAAWDWAETYFYGTADSGMQAGGHFLSTSPAGNKLWSGGADGPEGSLLVLATILLLLVALLVIYGRKKLGAPGPGSPRTGLRPWGGGPDFRTWESTNPNQPCS